MLKLKIQPIGLPRGSKLMVNLIGYLAIKAMFLDIGLNLKRDQIPYRFSLFNRLSDFCGGDIQNRDLFKMEGVT